MVEKLHDRDLDHWTVLDQPKSKKVLWNLVSSRDTLSLACVVIAP